MIPLWNPAQAAHIAASSQRLGFGRCDLQLNRSHSTSLNYLQHTSMADKKLISQFICLKR